MIELTQEQWQAMSGEEHPVVVDPESKSEFVVVPRDEFEKMRAVTTTEADAAYVLRVAWMRRMGLDEDEIADSMRDDPPTSVQEEMKQIRALDNLDKITPPASVLRKYAIQY